MLLTLRISNYAIIDSLEVDFSEGLNILTGETGAGKSIIVGALSLALGYRADTDAIRTGAQKASVTAVFGMPAHSDQLSQMLAEMDIEAPDGEIILRRDIFPNGRNNCRVNDVTVTVAALRRLSGLLIDIHGQHEHQKLLNAALHESFLDAYARDSVSGLASQVKTACDAVNARKRELADITEKARSSASMRISYETALAEIDAVSPRPGEDEEISERIKILTNAERIFSLTTNSYNALYASSDSVAARLDKAASDLEKAAEFDASLLANGQSLREASILVEEISLRLRDYRYSLEFEPDELDKLHERQSKINALCRRYAQDIPALIDYRNECENALRILTDSEAFLAEASRALEQAREEYLILARQLSAARQTAGAAFGQAVCLSLKELAMGSATFSVRVAPDEEKVGPLGFDEVTFLFSANPGQEARPLNRIASGGEISRVMLAIKSILADGDDTEVLIFDEIDTGISGRTAQTVSEKLWGLASGRQILCITHLPQIAAMADAHYLIEKTVSGDETFTRLYRLAQEGEVEEMARMLGGAQVTQTTLQHATEVLDLARNAKEKIAVG